MGWFGQDISPTSDFGGHKFGDQIDPRRNVGAAAAAQEDWINKAAEARRTGYNNALKQWTDTFSPYQGFGGNATKRWGNLLTDPSSVTQNPGYQFRLTQGQNTLENSAAARGGLLSGNALKSINEYGQNYASNEYDKALQRENNAAQFGATVDTNYANATANLQKELGLSNAKQYGDISNYAFWHEQQGMDEAKQWMGWLRGNMGSFGGGGGGGGGDSGGGGGGGMPSSGGGGGGGKNGSPPVQSGFMGNDNQAAPGGNSNSFLSYYNPSGNANMNGSGSFYTQPQQGYGNPYTYGNWNY